MTEEQKVLELAETLKKHGLAISIEEAVMKAKEILGISTNGEGNGIDFNSNDVDISATQKSINELMSEAEFQETKSDDKREDKKNEEKAELQEKPL